MRKHRMLSRFACCTLVFCALAAAGSARADGVVLPLPAEDQKEIDAQLGAGVVGKALPSQPLGDLSSYFALEERALIFQVTAGKNAGTKQTLKVMKGQRPGGNAAWRFELSPTLAGYLNQTTEGDLMMPAVADSGEGVIVITTPANPFLIKGMNPGESKSFTQTVAVNYLDDPAKQDYSGSLTGTYTYVGTYQVTIPAGSYEAVLVKLHFKGKVGPAHTEDTAYYFFAPGTGVVAMISQEDVEAFYVIHIDTTTGKVLAAK